MLSNSATFSKILSQKEKERAKLHTRIELLRSNIEIAKGAHQRNFLPGNTTYKYYLSEEEKVKERKANTEELFANKEEALLLARDREIEEIWKKYDVKLDRLGTEKQKALQKDIDYESYLESKKQLILEQASEPNTTPYNKMKSELDMLEQKLAAIQAEMPQLLEVQDAIQQRDRKRQVEEEAAKERAEELRRKQNA